MLSIVMLLSLIPHAFSEDLAGMLAQLQQQQEEYQKQIEAMEQDILLQQQAQQEIVEQQQQQVEAAQKKAEMELKHKTCQHENTRIDIEDRDETDGIHDEVTVCEDCELELDRITVEDAKKETVTFRTALGAAPLGSSGETVVNDAAALATALSEASHDSDNPTKIQLGADVSGEYTVESGTNIILDLNGRDISGLDTSLSCEGNLTLNDSVGGGTVSAVHVYGGGGSFTMNGGEVSELEIINWGFVTMNGGIVSKSIEVSGNFTMNDGTVSGVNMNNGSFTMNNGTVYGVIVKGGNVNIGGGTVSSVSTMGGKLTINGGTVSEVNIMNGSFVAMNDGTVSEDVHIIYGSFDVYGGTVNRIYFSDTQIAMTVIYGGTVGSVFGNTELLKYAVILPDDGTISSDTISTQEGKAVTLTVTPPEGNKLDRLTYTPEGQSGQIVAATLGDDGKYTGTFTMPAFPVNIKATFYSGEFNNKCGDNVTWSLADGVLTISGTGPMYDDFGYYGRPWFSDKDSITGIVIEDGVTSIGDDVFAGCYSLMSVTISDSVTSIGENAFNTCNSLASVTIPDSVASIGERAFCNCDSISSVTIPGSVTSIENNTFASCPNLEEFQVAEENPNYSSASGVLYNKEQTILIQAPSTITSIEIPSGVTSIGIYAFNNCKSLTSVTIPDSVTSIEGYAFYNCNNLTSVTIPDSVTSIGFYAFCDCDNLTSITIPGGVASIERNTFSYCPSLTSITIPNSVTSIGDDAFAGCSSLTSVTIPDSVTSIGESAFYNCNSISSVTIPDTVTSIGTYTFGRCSSLTSITIPASVTSIEVYAFIDCDGLTIVKIPASVISIGYKAFKDCDNLTDLYVDAKEGSVSTAEGWNGNATVHWKHTVAVNVDPENSGTVTGEGTYWDKDPDTQGSVTVTLKAAPNNNYVFLKWMDSDGNDIQDGNGQTLTANPYTFTMPNSDVTVTAAFQTESDTVNPPVNLNYSITVDQNISHGSITVPATAFQGTAVTVTVTSESGYKLEKLTFTPDGGTAQEITLTDGEYSFTMPASSVIVTATFIEKEVTPPEPTEKKVLYYFANGTTPVMWMESSTEGAGFTVHRFPDDENAFLHFLGIQVDGRVLSPRAYTAKSGSVKITLTTAYQRSLATGSYTLKAVFDDGEAETKFVVFPAGGGGETYYSTSTSERYTYVPPSNNPRTGG